jgi:hypothetical protein
MGTHRWHTRRVYSAEMASLLDSSLYEDVTFGESCRIAYNELEYVVETFDK